MKNIIKLWLIFWILLLSFQNIKAQESNLQKNYYVEAGSDSTKRIPSDPPMYARNLSETGLSGFENIDWLDLGLESRIRGEARSNDIRRSELTSDYPLLFKTKFYLGIKKLLDPLRLAVEFQDSQRENSKFPIDDRDVNRGEVIQAYGELFFKEGLGASRPFFARFGRQTFEFLDRRLIALNDWRNTTNNFLGFRTQFGQDSNDWQLDLLAVRPITRLPNDYDRTDNTRDFWAAIFHWRGNSDKITIEPYYLGLKQRPTDTNSNLDRSRHSPGLRLYGWFLNDKSMNFDLSYTKQFGLENEKGVDAYAATAEFGYTFVKHKYKPRLSLFYGYVTGDKDPNDKVDNRFERFFGFARPWSADDYIIPENIVTPKLKIAFEVPNGIKFDGGYSIYNLASASDRFANLLNGSAYNRDKTGSSGTFLGQSLDARIRFKATQYLSSDIGYSHFINGDFVTKRQEVAFKNSAPTSDFFYVSFTINGIDLFTSKLK